MRPMLQFFSFIFILILQHRTLAGSIFDHASKGKCEPIEISLCKDMPYNYTYYSSSMGMDIHALQAQTEHFKPLIKTKCNPHIQFFICSVFAPMCPPDMPQAVTSCRRVCEQAKAGCVSILEQFGLSWPEPLNCSKFPEEPSLCMKQPDMDSYSYNPRGNIRRPPVDSGICPSGMFDFDPLNPRGACVADCGRDLMFSAQDKKVVKSWMIGWGAVTLALTSFTFITFLIDRKRFRYPQRCIFYMALSYAFFSIPHLFPAVFEYREMACDKLHHGQQYLIFSGFENTICLFSFFLTYYFGTAIFLWWLIFGFTWYLSAGRKWVPEGVDAYSAFLHCFAWGLSMICTIAVLIMDKVDASELTGLCGVGNADPTTSLFFSLLPRMSALFIGALFVLAGFASMCRERESFRTRGTDTSKLERFMLKTGMFCVLFLLPAVVWLVCESYHYVQILRWQPVTTGCKANGGHCTNPPRPLALYYMLSFMVALATGLSTALWTLSRKSFLSWRNFLCCGLCGRAPQKAPSTSLAAARPLLEPPQGPPPQPPAGHYIPMSTHSAWRPSKVL